MNCSPSLIQPGKEKIRQRELRPRLHPLAGGITMALGLWSGTIMAVTINVDSLGDDINEFDGFCTLREAIASANSQASSDQPFECETGTGIDTINLSAIANGTISIIGGELEIDSEITLAGNNATLSSNDNSRIFNLLNDSSLGIQNATLTEGSTKYTGGAIYGESASLSLDTCTISNSTANYKGGGIYLKDSTATITACTFAGNYAGVNYGGGGGLFASGGSLNVSGSSFTDNEANYPGGGLAVGTGDATLQNVEFTQNKATSGGGLSFHYASNTVSLTNVNLHRNSATKAHGGGLSMYGTTVTMTGGSMLGNVSADKGAGLFANSSDVSLQQVEINENVASGQGGGVNSMSSNIAFYQSELIENRTSEQGAGLFASDGTVRFSESTVSGNEANIYRGGAMYLSGITATITKSEISRNSALRVGAIEAIGNSALNIEDSTISGNAAKEYAGALQVNGSKVTIKQSTLSGNSAGGHGSVATIANGGALSVEHSTMLALPPPGVGTPIYFYSNGSLDMANSILFSDLANDDCDFGVGVNPTITTKGNNLVGNPGNCTFSEDGLIKADPMLSPLADNGGENQTHKPMSGSPAIDGGDTSVLGGMIFFDQRGAPNTRAEGLATDLGALEIQGGDFSIQPKFYEVDEGAGTVDVIVSRVNKSEGAVYATLNTMDDEATAPGDYTAIVNGQVNWADGELGDKIVQVAINDDDDDEPQEDLYLRFSGPTSGADFLGGSDFLTVTIRIQDNDEPPVPGMFSLSPVLVEVNEDAGTAGFKLFRNGGSDGAVSVTVNTQDGTAESGLDYTAIVDQVVNFADGVSESESIAVDITDDDISETLESFTVELSNPTGGATISAGTGTVEITDNEEPISDIFMDGFEEPE